MLQIAPGAIQGDGIVSSNNKFLPVKYNLINHIGFYGAATHSRFGAYPDDSFYIRLVNDGSEGWASAGLEFKTPLDISSYDVLLIEAKGTRGGEKLWANFRDPSWHDPLTTQINTKLYPKGGLATTAKRVVLPLNEIKNTVASGALTHIGIEIGSETTGNPAGTEIVITKIMFGVSAPKQVPPQPDKQPPPVQQKPDSTPVKQKSGIEKVKPENQSTGAEALSNNPKTQITPSETNKANAAQNDIPSGMTNEKIKAGTWNTPAPIVITPKVEPPVVRRTKRTNSSHKNTSGFTFILVTVAIGLIVVVLWRKTWLERMNLGEIFPILEINTRAWKARIDYMGQHRPRRLFEIPDSELEEIHALGFRAIWLMGIWEISNEARQIAKRYSEDFAGSPYAIGDYKLNRELGTEKDLKKFVKRSHKAGLKVIVDFVPNHMGVGSPWIKAHPEFFIHKKLNREESLVSNEELRHTHPNYFMTELPPEKSFFIRKNGKKILVAHGKDPYFDPWTDTAQLNYASRKLRKHMTKTLARIARMCDGVRCDMAMLILRDYIRKQWHPKMPDEVFNRLMPQEFWPEVIAKIKKKRPDFTFIAECYWAQEGYLHKLGFDFTYNKHLYDLLRQSTVSGDPASVVDFLQKTGTAFLKKSLHFIENHDEERASVAFPEERYRPALALIATLPGAMLLHDGQMEGRKERLPVQRIIPVTAELRDNNVYGYYRKILGITKLPLFRYGNFIFLQTDASNVVTYLRRFRSETALIAINFCPWERKLNIVLPARAMDLRPENYYMFMDLLSPASPEGLNSNMVFDGSELYKKGLSLTLNGLGVAILKMEIASEDQIFKRQASLTSKSVIEEATLKSMLPSATSALYQQVLK